MQAMRRKFASPRRRAPWVALAAVASIGPLAAQQVYKSVDADGHVVYSDRGSNQSSVSTAVHVQESDPAGAAQLAKQQHLLEAADALRREEQAAEDKQRAAQAKQRQQACEKARNEYFRERDARRLSYLDAAGNRVYYSDEELEQMRERARRTMVTACGN
jgi:hypothetical protein